MNSATKDFKASIKQRGDSISQSLPTNFLKVSINHESKAVHKIKNNTGKMKSLNSLKNHMKCHAQSIDELYKPPIQGVFEINESIAPTHQLLECIIRHDNSCHDFEKISNNLAISSKVYDLSFEPQADLQKIKESISTADEQIQRLQQLNQKIEILQRNIERETFKQNEAD